MSGMKHKKGRLKEMLHRGEPLNIQNWLEMEWSVYCDEELDQETAYNILLEVLEENDIPCTYFLFDNRLFELVEERELDEYGYIEASFVGNGIEVGAHWYSGGASWGECINAALKKLEEDQKNEHNL